MTESGIDYERAYTVMKILTIFSGQILFAVVLLDGYYLSHISQLWSITIFHMILLTISAIIILFGLIYIPPVNKKPRLPK
jgi:hypothetical protein